MTTPKPPLKNNRNLRRIIAVLRNPQFHNISADFQKPHTLSEISETPRNKMDIQFWINVCIGIMFLIIYGWLVHIEKYLRSLK